MSDRETVWIVDTDHSGLHILAAVGENDDAYICAEETISLDAAR